MKNYISLFCLAVCLCSCGHRQSNVPEPGISKELAMMREKQIHDLRYHICFDIPENREEQVTGKVNIYFRLDKPEEVVLDFREKEEKIGKLMVNGKVSEKRVENEHIILSAKQMQKGENQVEIHFVAGEQSLNRNEEYLYTLLVPDRARTLFPCFDQPDLKALFTLELGIPSVWKAVSNAPVSAEEEKEGKKWLSFAETKPLSTYLFSFVAGQFDTLSQNMNGRKVTLYHRETDPAKISQADTIFRLVYASLHWLEEYTGIPYPFDKYDLVILPGYQFGGMEHPGAIQYNDKRMFLSEYPSLEEQLGRMELIAHETAHMWFGDDVTMEWFDDVWTKEVFANYFAARMTQPQFPQVNHRLKALRSFQLAAYGEDRTAGTNPVRQPLDNLNNAGLIYGQIVYNKAPVVMEMLVEMMGEEHFREGIQEYLRTCSYGNATWDDLISILDQHTVEDLKTWSRAWVSEKGMPCIYAGRQGNRWKILQQDEWGRKLVWPQKLTYLAVQAEDIKKAEIVRVNLKDTEAYTDVPEGTDYLLPNADGKGYGQFILDDSTADFCLSHLSGFDDHVVRLSLSIIMNENYWRGNISGRPFMEGISRALEKEQEALISSAWIGFLKEMALHGTGTEKKEIEQTLYVIASKGKKEADRQQAFRALMEVFEEEEITGQLYRVWKEQKPFPGLQLNEGDYMKLACELAVRMPEKYAELVAEQKERITNPDRQREFMFIVRASSPDGMARDTLFASLLKPENRRIEPWVVQAMWYLNHPLRQQQALEYIRPALEELQDIQRTGDIFFPKNWLHACLRGHNSQEAAAVVMQFLAEHPDYPVLMKNKILQSAGHLPGKWKENR